MLERSGAIDRVFHALADGTRRELIGRLSRGPASVSELARPLPISLAAVVQHVQVLEQSGLVRTSKVGRVRTCELDPRGLLEAERWIARRRALWEGRLDRLGALLEAAVAPAQIDPPATGAGSTPGTRGRDRRGSRRGPNRRRPT
jgi:DNA-binding transcriptional ArsR family regulator